MPGTSLLRVITRTYIRITLSKTSSLPNCLVPRRIMAICEDVFQGFAVRNGCQWRYPKKISFRLPPLGADEVDIRVIACGVCGSDMHCVSGRWGPVNDPLVVGHEVVGHIVRMGHNCQTKFRLRERVGTGAIAKSCGNCARCHDGDLSYCHNLILRFNGKYKDGSLSQGGFASHVRADMNHIVSIPEAIPSCIAAPLMCAGITAYAPLLNNNITKNSVVGVVGLGGVGHFAVIFAKFSGAKVYVFSRSPMKRKDAFKMGADHFISTTDNGDFSESLPDTIDLALICTNSFTEVDLLKIIRVMRKGAKIVSVAEPPAGELLRLPPFSLLGVSLECSAVGTYKQLKNLLKIVSTHRFSFWIETLPINEENVALAFDLMEREQVRYRLTLTNYDEEFVNSNQTSI